ncbi:MAG: S8 family serine peptidase [Caldilineales bacterium]
MRFLLICTLLAALMLPSVATAQTLPPTGFSAAATAKIDAPVLQSLLRGAQPSFLVLLSAQADLDAATHLTSKQAKGDYVYRTLQATAAATQAPLIAELRAAGVNFRALYIVNALVVKSGDAALAAKLAARPDVARLVANPTVQQPLEQEEAAPEAATPNAVEWGISNVSAPAVWSTYGVTGQGIVIAGQDTGIRWSHNALINRYRGWNGVTANHNYNWWDAIHSGSGSSCGINSAVPCDDNGHGTHTVGTVVGDDGVGNQVGVAPGAQWIGCRNMNAGDGTPATYAECFQFFLAPTDLAGQNADPSKAPHIINNSWGCPASEGCSSATWGVIQSVQQALRAAGVLVVASAGNSGSSCGSISTPLAIFPESFAVGNYTSSNVISGSSSRGPRQYTNIPGPDVSAPGTSVRSAINSSNTAYGTMSGTSMAGPHVVGVAALLWSAVPALVGQVPATEQYLRETALKDVSNTTCGAGSNTAPWNTWDNVYGWGRINALSAVRAARCPADLDYDRSIDVVDIQLMTSQWGLSQGDSSFNPRRDLDFDQTISVQDIVLVAEQWLAACN